MFLLNLVLDGKKEKTHQRERDKRALMSHPQLPRKVFDAPLGGLDDTDDVLQGQGNNLPCQVRARQAFSPLSDQERLDCDDLHRATGKERWGSRIES